MGEPPPKCAFPVFSRVWGKKNASWWGNQLRHNTAVFDKIVVHFLNKFVPRLMLNNSLIYLEKNTTEMGVMVANVHDNHANYPVIYNSSLFSELETSTSVHGCYGLLDAGADLLSACFSCRRCIVVGIPKWANLQADVQLFFMLDFY